MPNTVQAALDSLVINLESTDIGYVPSCGPSLPNTVRALLGVPASPQSSKVSDVLDKLLCVLNATHIPIDKSNICSLLKAGEVKTVQDALEALCDRPGLAVTTGVIVFPDVPPGHVRLHGPQPHGLGDQKVTISLAFAQPSSPTGGDSSLIQGSAGERFFQLSMATVLDPQNPDEFSLSFWDLRTQGSNRTIRVRWWAIPATNDTGPTNFERRAAFSGKLFEAAVVEYVKAQPGLPLADVAIRFQVPVTEMSATVTRLRDSNQLVLGTDNVVLPRLPGQ